MKNLKSRAISGVSWAFFDNFINKLGFFVLLVYLSRVLSPSDFGLIAMLSIFLAIAQSLVDSGFSQALIQKSTEVTEEDLSTVFYVNLIFSIFLYCLLYAVAPYIAAFYEQPELLALSRTLFVIIIINSLSLVPRSKLLIAIDFKSQGVINVVSMLVSSIVAVLMVQQDFGYWSLVGLNLSKSLLNSILLIIFAKWFPKWMFSKKSLSTLFSFGSKLLVAGIIATTVQNLYAVLIGRYFNSIQVGYFQQAFSYTNIISTTLSSIVQGVTYPVMTSIQKDKDRLVNMYIKVMGVVTLITFPIFVGFAAVAEEFVHIFLGEQWIPIISILITLSFARLITPMSSLNLNILNARGRSDLFLKTDISKLPMMVVALFIAIPYGITGVAIAQLITTIISFFINTYYPGKLFGFGAKEQLKIIFPVALASLIMFLIMSLIKLDSVVTQLVIKLVVGFCIYCILCRCLKIQAFSHVVQMLLIKIKRR